MNNDHDKSNVLAIYLSSDTGCKVVQCEYYVMLVTQHVVTYVSKRGTKTVIADTTLISHDV